MREGKEVDSALPSGAGELVTGKERLREGPGLENGKVEVQPAPPPPPPS